MKKFLSRMNRGIALGIVLLVGLAVYLTADALAFGRETEEIHEFIAEYLEELERLNAVFFSSVEEGSQIEREQMREEVTAFLSRYFVEYRASSLGNVNLHTMLSSKQRAKRALERVVDFYADYREMLLDGSVDGGFLEEQFSQFVAESVEFRLVNIYSVRKQAPNAVRVNFSVRIEILPAVERFAFFFDGFDGFSFRPHGDMTVSALLFRRGGEWRIANVQNFGFRNMTTVTHENVIITSP